MLTTLRHTARYLLVGLLFLALAPRAQAIPLLTLTPAQSIIFVLPGDSITVNGNIINRSNLDLDSTDLFLNFSDFDPDALTPLQELGLVAFRIPSFSFKNDVALFTIDVAENVRSGPQTLDVLLQDVQGNFSDVTTLTLNVEQIAAVPEPATLAIMLAGLPMFIRRPRHFADKGGHHGYRS